jgi:hypothetical protein
MMLSDADGTVNSDDEAAISCGRLWIRSYRFDGLV